MSKPETSKTGLIYDVLMTKHQNEINPYHPETPERIAETWRALDMEGLTKRCEVLESREATDADILIVHSEEHLGILSSTTDIPQNKLNQLSQCYNSIFINPHTFTASRLAAGCVIELTEGVVSGRVRNGVALVRPPGHHAERYKPMGFCHMNNVAIAAEYALNTLGLQRVLIVDWDIHHGNGTQHHFYEDSRVLYFSLHRFDDGLYFPCADDANFNYVGSGAGTGFNINVAWNDGVKGDMDYLLAFHHILIPVALEFDPELVIVSCGFDAGLGDHLGGYRVTPAGYAHMTHLLMGVAQGRLVLALEGGYNLTCIRESTSAIVSVLLGDTPLPEIDKAPPSESALVSIHSTMTALAPHWKTLNVIDHVGIAPAESPLPVGETPETGEIPESFGRAKPSKHLEQVLLMLKDDQSHDASQGESHDHTPMSQDGSHDHTPVKLERSHDHTPTSPEGSHDHTPMMLEGSHDQAPSSTTSTLSQESGSHDAGQGSHDVNQGSHDAKQGSHDPHPSASAAGPSTVNPDTVKQLIQSLEQDGHTTMFAVAPKPWCEHLSEHVKPLPLTGIDSTHPCETCGSKQEPWVCLDCYHVYCGRYVQEHMVVHQDTAGHKMALSLADLSVWCYLCDSYISNHVLTPAINSAHLSKFGHNMDGSAQ